jgi:hypothetical protein
MKLWKLLKKIARAHLSPEHTETNTTYSSASDDKSSILVLNFALLGEFETTTNELHETKKQNPFVSAKFAGFRDIPDAHITCKALEGQKNHGTKSNEPRQLQSDASFSWEHVCSQSSKDIFSTQLQLSNGKMDYPCSKETMVAL